MSLIPAGPDTSGVPTPRYIAIVPFLDSSFFNANMNTNMIRVKPAPPRIGGRAHNGARVVLNLQSGFSFLQTPDSILDTEHTALHGWYALGVFKSAF